MKFLIIDDSECLILAWQRLFKNNKNVAIARCVNIKEALEAIEKHEPDILLVDHSLSQDGREGLIIADKALKKGIKVYSITAHDANKIISEYKKRGIKILGKDIKKIKAVIERK